MIILIYIRSENADQVAASPGSIEPVVFVCFVLFLIIVIPLI